MIEVLLSELLRLSLRNCDAQAGACVLDARLTCIESGVGDCVTPPFTAPSECLIVHNQCTEREKARHRKLRRVAEAEK